MCRLKAAAASVTKTRTVCAAHVHLNNEKEKEREPNVLDHPLMGVAHSRCKKRCFGLLSLFYF